MKDKITTTSRQLHTGFGKVPYLSFNAKEEKQKRKKKSGKDVSRSSYFRDLHERTVILLWIYTVREDEGLDLLNTTSLNPPTTF